MQESIMPSVPPIVAMTKVEIGRYRAKIECLRRNKENIARDLLMTKYRKPYAKLQQELKVMTEQIIRDVAAYYLPFNGSYEDEMVEDLNHQIARLGIMGKISDAVFHQQDADLVIKYAMQVRQLAWEMARRWNYGS